MSIGGAAGACDGRSVISLAGRARRDKAIRQHSPT